MFSKTLTQYLYKFGIGHKGGKAPTVYIKVEEIQERIFQEKNKYVLVYHLGNFTHEKSNLKLWSKLFYPSVTSKHPELCFLQTIFP